MQILNSYVNGNHRTIVYDNGTKVKETGHYAVKDGKVTHWVEADDDRFTYDFPENMEIKITDKCENGCLYCHMSSVPEGKHGDLRSMEHIISSMVPGTECTITGGNPLSHPDLLWFLEKLKERGIVVNMTINQRQLKPHKDLICRLVVEKLVFGLGISLADSHCKEDFKFIDSLGPNVVIHVVAGIFSKRDLPAVINRRILVLGYRDSGRGHTLLEKHKKEIDKNIDWLRKKLPALQGICKIISYDALGLQQVNPKKVLSMSDGRYDNIYSAGNTPVMDDAGNITWPSIYIDLPAKTVAYDAAAETRKELDFEAPVFKLLKTAVTG